MGKQILIGADSFEKIREGEFFYKKAARLLWKPGRCVAQVYVINREPINAHGLTV